MSRILFCVVIAPLVSINISAVFGKPALSPLPMHIDVELNDVTYIALAGIWFVEVF